jgi:hypothetical protein
MCGNHIFLSLNWWVSYINGEIIKEGAISISKSVGLTDPLSHVVGLIA